MVTAALVAAAAAAESTAAVVGGVPPAGGAGALLSLVSRLCGGRTGAGVLERSIPVHGRMKEISVAGVLNLNQSLVCTAWRWFKEEKRHTYMAAVCESSSREATKVGSSWPVTASKCHWHSDKHEVARCEVHGSLNVQKRIMIIAVAQSPVATTPSLHVWGACLL